MNYSLRTTDVGSRREGPLALPTPVRFPRTGSLNDDDSQRVSIKKRAEGDEPTWEDVLKTGKKILADHKKKLGSDDSGDAGIDSEKAKDVLQNKYEVESEGWD